MKAKLILEDGTEFNGKAFGYIKSSVGEVVFNTSMTGYGEILTDPSYYGQIVTLTYPLIGNYGINFEDPESKGVYVRGLIVREKCDMPNNFRCEMDLDTYLKQNKVIGLEGIDTRALTKILRNHGTMRGIITVETSDTLEDVKPKLDKFDISDAVMNVTRKEIEKIPGNGKKVAVLDFGIKENILRSLKKRDCDMTVFPADFKPEDILNGDFDLVFLSNGPGDPKDLKEQIENIKALIGKIPIAGICLGHQLMALAMGGDTTRLTFGHRGGNHPVIDKRHDRVFITSQNHGYYVKDVPEGMEVSHINLNDNTISGMRHKELPIFTVQYHPEACPGPQDSGYVFDEFLELAVK